MPAGVSEESYAAIWVEPGGDLARGKATLHGAGVRLEGSTAEGLRSVCEIAYGEIEGVRVGRARGERLNGRPTLLLERTSAPPLFLDVLGPGMLFELADVLAALTVDQAEQYERVTLIVPLKKGKLEDAEALVAAGPPFDPAAQGLVRHEVFLTDREALFLFEGPRAREVVQRLARDPDAWRAAVRWRGVLAGAPRLARPAYAWQGEPDRRMASLERGRRVGGSPS